MENEGSSADGWVRDARRSLFGELTFFFRTLAAFLRAPRRFTTSWVSGQIRPMNPLGYLGMCALFVGPVDFLVGLRTRSIDEQTHSDLAHILHVSPDVADVVRSTGPYLWPLCFCLIAHPCVRLFGSKQPLTTTLGTLFYAYGFQVISSWLLLPYRYFVGATSGAHPLLTWIPLGTRLVLVYLSVAGMRAAHGLSRMRTALALFSFLLACASIIVALSLIDRHFR